MRVTESQLKARVDEINRITKSPASPYIDGKAQIGNFHLSYAYGGVNLSRMHNDLGGTSSPLGLGHVTKRELFDQLCAFIKGIQFAIEELS